MFGVMLTGDAGAPHFWRRLNDWEVDKVVRLLRRLHRWWVGSDEEDMLAWEGGREEWMWVPMDGLEGLGR